MGRAVDNYCCNKVDWSDKWCTRVSARLHTHVHARAHTPERLRTGSSMQDDCFGTGCRKGEADIGVACPRIQGWTHVNVTSAFSLLCLLLTCTLGVAECPCKELVAYKTRHKCLVEQACAAVVAGMCHNPSPLAGCCDLCRTVIAHGCVIAQMSCLAKKWWSCTGKPSRPSNAAMLSRYATPLPMPTTVFHIHQ